MVSFQDAWPSSISDAKCHKLVAVIHTTSMTPTHSVDIRLIKSSACVNWPLKWIKAKGNKKQTDICVNTPHLVAFSGRHDQTMLHVCSSVVYLKGGRAKWMKGLLLCVCKSRLLSLHQRELEQIIFVKPEVPREQAGGYRRMTECGCIPKRLTRYSGRD